MKNKTEYFQNYRGYITKAKCARYKIHKNRQLKLIHKSKKQLKL